MHSIFFSFFIICALIGETLLSFTSLYAATSDIIITEIVAYEKSNHEWVEIYNKGSVPVDLTGWKFVEDGINHGLSAFRGDLTLDPGEYAVIADDATNTAMDYLSFTGTLIDSSWQTLREDGESIGLAAADGAIIEKFTYVSAADGSLQRISALLNDYTTANWNKSASGTNSIGAAYVAPLQAPVVPPSATPLPPPAQPSEQVDQQQGQQQPPKQQIVSSWKPARSDIVINEFVADPGDEPKEWIELYNNSPVPINLAGWFLEDGSRNVIALKGILGVSGSSRFAVIESSNAILNNTGDSITLRDADGAGIDSVSYGDWDDGVVENNAPRAQDPASVARFPDGYNSFYNATDFQVTEKPTKGESNILISTKTSSEPQSKKSSIMISELFPYPFPATTSAEEFIELHNTGDKPIDLDGWRIVAGSVSHVISKKNATSTSIAAGGYVAIPRSMSTIALRNHSGETVTLYESGKEKAVDSVSYKIDAPPNKSYARLEGGGYAWTDSRTPGEANAITKANEPPHVALFTPLTGAVGEDVLFDASDTRDPDDDPLVFEWDFDDGSSVTATPYSVVHRYHRAGIYEVKLTVRAGAHEKIQTRHITIMGTSEALMPLISLESKEKILEHIPPSPLAMPANTATSSAKIQFNELLPNPSGRDRGQEFIELYNASDAAVDISQWIIELQGGKTRYTIPDRSTIEARGYFIIPASGGSVVLRNSGDELVLRDWYGTAIDSIDYEESPEGESFAHRVANDWRWTSHISRGSQNSIEEESEESSQEGRKKSSVAGSAKQLTSTLSLDALSSSSVEDFAILQGVKQNTMVVVRGRVTVPPGVFDPKELYISDGKNGMLVKHTKTDLPSFSPGDLVEVRGSFKRYVSGAAVSLGTVGAIYALAEETATVSESVKLSIQSIDDNMLNALVAVSGEVTQVRWPHIYVQDASGQIRVYVKKSTGIEKMDLQKGQQVDVSGIVGKTASGYRILPRTADDVNITGSRRVEVTEEPEYTIVAERASLSSYGVAALAALAIVSGGLFLQYYQRRKNE